MVLQGKRYGSSIILSTFSLFLILLLMLMHFDQVIQDEAMSHDEKRLFYSTLMNDNLLDCIITKVQVVQITSSVSLCSFLSHLLA